MARPVTIATLRYIKPKELAEQLLNPETSGRVAVIDVRDNDYLGGHIKGGIHAPVDQLDARMPELLRILADKERVVFHCMLSQQRGPASALAYARAKAAVEAKKAKESQDEPREQVSGTGDAANLTTTPSQRAATENRIGGQQICVLEGGFQAWQQTIGGDARLTEGYIAELWDAEIF